MQIQMTPYPVEILTADYQAAGALTARGNPANFINDPAVQSFSLKDAIFTPLMAGARIGEMSLPAVYLPRANIHILLIGDFSTADANLLPRAIPLICFTNTYAIRGTFHTGAETQQEDVFSAMAGPFLPVTRAEIYSIRPLAQDISGAADLLYVHKGAIRGYHEPVE